MRDFHFPGRSEVLATNGMCATSHPLAAQVAIDMLCRGGNAMDAAIAASVLLGICEPQMTGIGGDCFALYSRAGSGRVLALNGSGRAPAAADAAALRARGLTRVPVDGPEAVTIPGAVDAFCHLAETEGRLGIDTLLQPAIRYAEEGVPVAARVGFDWEADQARLQGAGRRHYLVGGRAPAPGRIFASPAQAGALRRIARDGRDGFYAGEVAADMLAVLNRLGGVHRAADFEAARCLPATPVGGFYKGAELLEHPPNGQGATAILMLNILRRFDLAALDPLGTERAHLETEAAKLAYDARNRFIADPDHATRLDHMLSEETADRLAALIDPKRAAPDPAALAEAVHRDTVYVTVVDRDRMAVSLISSIYNGFGSGIASEKFGVLFQNRGAGFNLTQGHPNELGGGKRPMHTIVPAMLRAGGRVTMPFGVMGGAYQPQGHVRLITNLVDFGMGLQAAVDAPRLSVDAGETRVERGYSDPVRRALAEMGHNLVTPRNPIGGAQAIRIRDDGVLEAASDPRKDGCALGY